MDIKIDLIHLDARDDVGTGVLMRGRIGGVSLDSFPPPPPPPPSKLPARVERVLLSGVGRVPPSLCVHTYTMINVIYKYIYIYI